MLQSKQESKRTSRRHGVFLALAALVIALFATVLPAAPASAASPGEFVGSINGLRASKGLGSLTVDGRLSSFAQAWAEKMAAAGKISHNPSLSSIPGNWTKVGENVGVGGSVDSIFNALVASTGHYNNMVDSKFTSVGVGVATGADGRIYTAHNFAAYPGATAAAAPKTTSAPKAAAPKTASAPKTTSAPKKAATPAATTKTTSAPESTPTTEAPAAPVETPPAPVLPLPSDQIVQSLTEVSGINTQG